MGSKRRTVLFGHREGKGFRRKANYGFIKYHFLGKQGVRVGAGEGCIEVFFIQEFIKNAEANIDVDLNQGVNGWNRRVSKNLGERKGNE